jgi:cyclase
MKSSNVVWMLALILLSGGTAFGQGQAYNSLGVDFSGYWSQLGRNQDAGLGTAAGELGDYTGVPLSEAGRLHALAFSASQFAAPHHICFGYVAPYVFVAPGYFRIWEDRDPYTQELNAIKMHPYGDMPDRTFWMDDRPHPPPYAPHTWTGFSTAKYEGNILTAYTTHIKQGLIRANGVEQSDQGTLEEFFIRHGDRITYFSVVNDPIYLDAPWAKTSPAVQVANDPNNWTEPCDDAEVLLDQPDDRFPSYLWGQHPFLQEFTTKHSVPELGALGGPATIHPEFMAKLKDSAAADAAARAELIPRPGPPEVSRAADPDPHDGEIHILPVRDNIYMLVGDGGNITVQVGNPQVGKDEGVIVVDSGAGRLSDKVISAIRTLSNKKIQFIINTSFHLDHTGGNVKLHDVGYDPEAHGGNLRALATGSLAVTSQFGVGATILAHENVLNRMTAPQGKIAPTPEAAWPTDTYLRGRRRKLHNGEGVELFWEPNAITDGDSIVHFRRADVIVAGDILNTNQYPFIDIKAGGSLHGEIAALNDILNRTVSFRAEGGTWIVPGHGRLCSEWEVTLYRDMLVLIRDRVQAMINKGATLQDVLAARVSADYDARFGANSGPWTTAMFIEAVYTSLKEGPTKKAL